MSGPADHSNVPDNAGETPGAGSAPDRSNSADPNYSGAETEATRINEEQDGYRAASGRGGKIAAIATAIVLIAAAAFGGRLWWAHEETKKAIAALEEEGAVIHQRGSHMRIEGKSDTFEDEDLAIVGRISGPFVLSLTANSRITDKGLAYLSGMTNIIGLELGKTGVTDAGMVHLGTLTGLERLDIGYNKNITDEGVKNLGRLVHLKELTMSATSVSDAGIDPLTKLTQLQFLLIGATKVSEAGEKKLKDAIGPDQLIVFRD